MFKSKFSFVFTFKSSCGTSSYQLEDSEEICINAVKIGRIVCSSPLHSSQGNMAQIKRQSTDSKACICNKNGMNEHERYLNGVALSPSLSVSSRSIASWSSLSSSFSSSSSSMMFLALLFRSTTAEGELLSAKNKG